MKTLVYSTLLAVLIASCVSMPPCRAREDINPLDQAPSLFVGENKDMALNVKFIVDEQNVDRNYIYFEVIGPSAIQTFTEDSAMLTLENGYEISLINARNHRARAEEMKALVVDMNFHYIRYMAPISNESIRKMAANRVRSIRMNLKTFDSPTHQLAQLPEKHWTYSKN